MGIRFTIDHYEPQSKCTELINEYSNLMWACDPCNDHKGDDCPGERRRLRGYRYFRPDQDEASDHFELNDVMLIPTSNTGEFTINFVGLNREQLVRLRTLRKRNYAAQEVIARGLRALRGKSIDQFPPRVRIEAIQRIRQLGDDVASLDDTLRDLNKSILIDPDPRKKEHAKTRRDYLRKVRTICSE